jgi:hypothetical protein
VRRKLAHLGITARLIRKSKGCVMRGRIRDSFSSKFISTSPSAQSQSADDKQNKHICAFYRRDDSVNQNKKMEKNHYQFSQKGRNGSQKAPTPYVRP